MRLRDALQVGRRPARTRIENRDGPRARNGLQQQLETLRLHLLAKHRNAGHVAARSRIARDDSRFEQARAAPERHHHGNGRGRLPRRDDRRRAHGDDEVDGGAHELRGESRKAVEPVVGGANFDSHGLSVDIAQLPQRREEGLQRDLRRHEETDSPDFRSRLRRCDLRHEQQGGQAQKRTGDRPLHCHQTLHRPAIPIQLSNRSRKARSPDSLKRTTRVPATRCAHRSA